MKSLLVVNGRLAWPPVLATVFLATSAITVDFVWRTVSVSIEVLAISFVLIASAGLIVIFVLSNSIRKRRRLRTAQ
jgi:hypothetical protein